MEGPHPDLSPVWLVIVAVLQGVRMWVTDSLLVITGGIVAVFLVIMVILWLVDNPVGKGRHRTVRSVRGRIPVPPLPGQQLPPSPRAGREPVGVTTTPTSSTDVKEERDE